MSTKKTKGTATDVDVHVGQRLRAKRTLLGMSQEKLAEIIGLTFQQVQKYERGTNRISASRLFDISHALSVPVSYFFDQMSDVSNDKTPRPMLLSDNEQDAFEGPESSTKPLDHLEPVRRTIQSLEAYYATQPQDRREAFITEVKAMLERLSKTS